MLSIVVAILCRLDVVILLVASCKSAPELVFIRLITEILSVHLIELVLIAFSDLVNQKGRFLHLLLVSLLTLVVKKFRSRRIVAFFINIVLLFDSPRVRVKSVHPFLSLVRKHVLLTKPETEVLLLLRMPLSNSFYLDWCRFVEIILKLVVYLASAAALF